MVTTDLAAKSEAELLLYWSTEEAEVYDHYCSPMQSNSAPKNSARLSAQFAQAFEPPGFRRGLLVSDGDNVGSTLILASIVSMGYDRNSSTILRVVVVVQPQPKVLYMLETHPSSEDGEHGSGSSSKMTTSSNMLITGGDFR